MTTGATRAKPGAMILGVVGVGMALFLASCGSSNASRTGSGGTWTPLSPMLTAREGGGAGLGTSSVRLPDGKVLVVGGYNTLSGKFETKPEFFLKSAEIYDPSTNTWRATGAMNHPRFGAAVVALPKLGQVLAAGGGAAEDNTTISSSAEVFDPRAGTWKVATPMGSCRMSPSAAVLASGDVVLVGGIGCDGKAQASTEIFHAATGDWTPAASMQQARWGHSSTVLPDGRILVVGGRSTPPRVEQEEVLSSAEIYDPGRDSWTPTSSLHVARALHVAALLTSSKVIVAGGHGQDPADIHSSTSTAELYDPATGTWTDTGSMRAGREEGGAMLLSDGTVLVAGGGQQVTTEIYHPASGEWSPSGTMNGIHDDAQLVMLDTGDVLVAGGFVFTDHGYRNVASAEVFHPPG